MNLPNSHVHDHDPGEVWTLRRRLADFDRLRALVHAAECMTGGFEYLSIDVDGVPLQYLGGRTAFRQAVLDTIIAEADHLLVKLTEEGLDLNTSPLDCPMLPARLEAVRSQPANHDMLRSP